MNELEKLEFLIRCLSENIDGEYNTKIIERIRELGYEVTIGEQGCTNEESVNYFKEVFGEEYEENLMLNRLQKEFDDLRKNEHKLFDFIVDDNNLKTLSDEHQFLLNMQNDIMVTYLNILERRIKLLNNKQ